MSSFDRALMERLISRGATLDERLRSEEFLPPESGTRIGKKRLLRWREACEKFDPQGFARRLRWAGIDPDPSALMSRLGPLSLPPRFREPAWVSGVEKITFQWKDDRDPDRDAWMDEIPFSDLIGPIAVAAGKEIEKTDPAYVKRFSATARQNLVHALAEELADYLAPALLREFGLFRIAQGVSPESCRPGQRDAYRTFITNIRETDGPLFLVKYAAASRAVAWRIETWLRNTRELLQRLERDMREIIPRFLLISPGATVQTITANMSDPHAGGKSVMALEFEGGQRLFYKPRHVGIETFLHAMAESLQRGRPGGPRWSEYIAPVIDRGEYGWSMAIVPAPEMTQAQAERYFAAAGEVLAFAYVFGGADLHDENIVASRNGPVLVDAEVFAAPRPPTAGRPVAEFETVLRTGLLPQWLSFGDGQTVQIAGFSGGRTFLTGYREKVWRDLNNDAMRVDTREVVVQAPDENCVRLTDARAVGPADFQNEILRGFQNGYQHLAAGAADMQWRDSLRDALRNVPVRFLLRNTNIYTTLRQRVLDPRFLTESVDRDLEFEALLSPYLAKEEPPPAWEILLEERRQWISGDIPRFEVSAYSREWGDTPAALFSRSGLECLEETLNRLGPADASYQSDLIGLTLQATEVRDDRQDSEQGPSLLTLNKGLRDPWRSSLMLADRILAAAKGENETLFWIGTQFDQHTSRYRIETLGPDLYDRFCGIALFLALMARLSGEERFAAGARRALHPIIGATATRQWNASLDDEQGAVVGRTAAAWAMGWVAELLDDTAVRGAAQEHANRIAVDHIEAADLFTGLSGILLCARQRFAVDTSLRDDLLSRLIGGLDVDRRDVGISHGLSGIMLGLASVMRDEPRASGIWGKIRSHIVTSWDAKLAGWKNVAGASSDQLVAAHIIDNWNHGSTGVLHALLQSWASPDAQLDRTVATTLARLEAREPLGWDNLGSGNAGLIAFWNAIRRPECAQRHVDHMLARAGRDLVFELPLANRFSHGLFTGTAGIGLALAQFAEPAKVPDFLVWPEPGIMTGREREHDHAAV